MSFVMVAISTIPFAQFSSGRWVRSRGLFFFGMDKSEWACQLGNCHSMIAITNRLGGMKE